jgi:hypothetical protein
MIRHHHRIAGAIALTLTLAIAAPAYARLDLNPPSASPPRSATTGAALPHDPRPRSVALAAAQPKVVHVVAPSDGFHWGDAGIGAGGALVLMTLIAGGVLVAATARRRTTSTTAH